MSKFLLNLLVQIFKALVYSKIKFYSEKNFPRHFRPTRSFGPVFFSSPPPLGHGLLAGPAHRTAQPTTFFHLPHQRRARTVLLPVGLAPPPRSPRRFHRKRKMAASNSPSFPPLIGAISPSSIPETGTFNPTIEAPSTPVIEDARPRLRPIKADPAPGEAPHTSNALIVALPSRAFRRR
jgi:hypothetical protein